MAGVDTTETKLGTAYATACRVVAATFTDALSGRGDLTAAAFRVSAITGMWNEQAPTLLDHIMTAYEDAAHNTATSLNAQLPPDWRDLPGRTPSRLPAPAATFRAATAETLNDIGNRLGERARAELTKALDAGESPDQQRDRLAAVFGPDGPQLGPSRAERLARTDATRIWNAATLDAARTVDTDSDLTKEWVSRNDGDVRTQHLSVHGETRPLNEPFIVDGVAMDAPGDPTAPAGLTINCRCVLQIRPRSARTAAYESIPDQRPGVYETQENPTVLPTNLPLTAADGTHTGAMIALIPSQADAERLAVPGGEPADELHLTLYYLGEADQWTATDRSTLLDRLTDWAAAVALPVQARAFGVNRWNTDTDDPVSVWAVSDHADRDPDAPTLDQVHTAVTDTVRTSGEGPPLPDQHTPWQPHVTAAYTDDTTLLPELETRLGPLAFDRLRVAFAGENTDIPLGPEETPVDDEPATTAAADAMPTRAWSTPDDTAIAFEDQQTGDGRLFTWDGAGPWPLQYADEMLMGHEGAELAGAIQEMGRDGDRITASGVLYLSRPAGADAATLLEEGAPLGISVDLDDVDVELVDTSSDGAAGDTPPVLAATLTAASVLQLHDGGLLLNALSTPTWTASGAAFTRGRQAVQIVTGPGGRITASAVRNALAGTGAVITAAAGDPDPEGGTVVHSERSGELLMRITRGRVRGATLVAMPAYDRARIVLDPITDQHTGDQGELMLAAASKPGPDHQRVVSYVTASPVPVGARIVAQALGISMECARGHLARAAEAGRIVRLAPGLYIGATATLPEGEATAATSGDTALAPPWPDDTGSDTADDDELTASAWTAMRDADPMPADWFREPTVEELPPGSGGVHYVDGRVYGWVAQAGEPHAGYPGKKLTIESLGDIDTTHFLRARFALDDGTLVKAGAFTMNVGHHRDGAECETDACQFDDTRTVAAVVTVGMNSRGMWFSGAAAPWLSEWDRAVFQACQPSYHMKQGRDRRWQLRAVLSVPVPGHSSPLLATAVAERSNLALAASAASATAVVPAPRVDADSIQGQIVAALTDPAVLDALATALRHHDTERDAEHRAEIERMAASIAPLPQEITASAARKEDR